MRVVITLLIVVTIAGVAFASCGVCGSKSGVVCHDPITFSFCSNDGNVDATRYPCPSGTRCGNDYSICSPDPDEACNPVCGNCTARFACLSESTYALCFGQGYPSGNIFTCPEGTSCSTQKGTPLIFCHSKMSLYNKEIDCYKDIVVEINGSDGGLALLPPVGEI